MSGEFFTSIKEREEATQLLSKKIPDYRQAYSDRAAWIMSAMSELAYVKFNHLFPEGNPDIIKDYFIKTVEQLVGENKAKNISTLIDKVAWDPKAEKEKLKKNLGEFKFKLKKTFDENGTQAILIDAGDYIILSFRGTEPESLRDIKSDAEAIITKCTSTKGRIHSGFQKAFNHVGGKIADEIKGPEYADKPLFITGHSLGGALATVATKYLTHRGGIAACYTFGSPRVGDDEWINNIKTPIHRLVNAADCVTMLPPGDVVISAASLILKLVPYLGEKPAEWFSEKFGNYMHAGNMRYLTNCKSGDYDDVKVLYSVSFTYRLKALIMKSLPFKKLLTDHSISTYRRKLMIIALKRNNK